MEKSKIDIEKVKDERTHIWNAFLFSTSGTLALLVNLNTYIKDVLFAFGIVVSILLFFVYLNKGDQINYYSNKIIKE